MPTLIFAFRDDAREWPLFASHLDRSTHQRWRNSFQREIERRERHGMPLLGSKAVVLRAIEGGEHGSQKNSTTGHGESRPAVRHDGAV